MLGLTKTEFEALTVELLPKIRVLNKNGQLRQSPLDWTEKQLLGDRQQLFIALLWMRRYMSIKEQRMLFDLTPQRVWRFVLPVNMVASNNAY